MSDHIEAAIQQVEDDSTVQIRVGGIEYSIDITKIPYFNSFLRFQRSSGQNSSQLPTHDEIPFFDIIDKGIKIGFRQFFRLMPTRINDYRVLCETLEFLCIDVLSGRGINSIMGDLRSGKHYWNEHIFKTWARDSAFRLLYLFLLGDFGSDFKDSNRAYNAALFVVSHCGIFERRTRKMVREAYEERFDVSAKQLRELDKWEFHPPAPEYSEDDLTTESEDLSFDFDYDYYSDRS